MARNLPYSRADRIAHQVYQVIAQFLYQDIDDPRLEGVQITNTKLTRDLSLLRIYFYVVGDNKRHKEAKEALEDHRHQMLDTIAHELVLKSLPKIEFFLDEGFENAERIQGLLEKIKSSEA